MEERSDESSERREGREIEYIYVERQRWSPGSVLHDTTRREHRKKKSPLKFPALN